MTTFRPIKIQTDAADIARLYNSTVNGTLTAAGVIDWWTPREGEIRFTMLAQALKLQTILLAKKEGMRFIRTHNDSNNAPMLAINRKLGYKPEPGFYKLVCSLDSAGGDNAQPS